MNFKNFVNDLTKVTEANDQLTDESVLQDTALWDSLAIVSTIALINQHFSVRVSGLELAECKTVGDILSLIKTYQRAVA